MADGTPPPERHGTYWETYSGPWKIQAWWSPQSRGGPTELRISTDDPDAISRGITTAALRRIPLAAMSRELRDDLTRTRAHAEGITEDDAHRALAHITAALARDTNPRAKGRPASFWLAVAVACTWKIITGEGDPARSLARDTGVPHQTALRWIHNARRAGMLTTASRGERKGGSLTPHARQLLTELEDLGK